MDNRFYYYAVAFFSSVGGLSIGIFLAKLIIRKFPKYFKKTGGGINARRN